MQASQERVSCVNVHVCLYVTYNTPISLCTAQLSLKQTPFWIFTFTLGLTRGRRLKIPLRVWTARASPKRGVWSSTTRQGHATPPCQDRDHLRYHMTLVLDRQEAPREGLVGRREDFEHAIQH